MDRPVTPGCSSRPRPSLFRALGKNEPPQSIEIDGQLFTLEQWLKHDSWAATAVYAGEPGRVVCKFNRTESILGVPMRWLGRRLARREAAFLATLADAPYIPRVCGPVTSAQTPMPNAVAHWFVDGRPLARDDRVDDQFFPRLRQTLDTVHARGIAYIDLHKAENILVTPDGRPCLIDFQIGQSMPRGVVLRAFIGPWIRMFQRMDDYHLMKHILRLRPDLVPADQRDIARYRPLSIRVCRVLGNPLRATRRAILRLLGVRDRTGKAESEVAPEVAVRQRSGASSV